MDLIFQQELPQQYTPRMDINNPKMLRGALILEQWKYFPFYVNIVRYAKLSECDVIIVNFM